MTRTILELLACIAFAVLLAILLTEWLAGCGEHYIDARGVVHTYPCVFVPQREEGK